MAINKSELKKLALRSGGVCAFPECHKPLTMQDPETGAITVLGHISHIVAEQDDGPRGDPMMTPEARNRYENLLLLCTGHHQLVDAPANHAKWTIARLTALRDDHEAWVRDRLMPNTLEVADATELRRDTVYSTLLPVERMPHYVFRADSPFHDRNDVPDPQAGLYPLMAPYIIHDRGIWAFQDLRDKDGPFAAAVDRGTVERFDVAAMARNPETFRLVQQLLNRTLHKLAGRRDLAFDADHRRYYFPPREPGVERHETYSSLTGRTSQLSVVWQPVIKARAEKRKYWLHRALSLGFVYVGSGAWCLAMRPEFHVTADSVEPLASEKIGARVTRRKSRMFNADLLTELQFWRHYLGDGMPRLVMKFSESQAVHVSTTLLHGRVDWPGIPPEHDVVYSNVEYLDDLLTIAETYAVELDDHWDDSEEELRHGSDEDEAGDARAV